MKRIIIACLVVLGVAAWPATLLAKSQGMISLENNFALLFRFGMEVNYYQFDFPDEILTVPAHPDDSATGSTRVDFDEGWGYNFRLSPRFLYGSEDIPLYLIFGADLGLNPSAINAYRYGVYKTSLCDYGGESYAYGQLLPAWYIFNPAVGIMIGPVILEVGFPYNEFTLITGHDRWGRWDEVDSHTWKGFGQRYFIGVDLMLGVGLSYESYPAEFAGHNAPINIWSLLLTYRFL